MIDLRQQLADIIVAYVDLREKELQRWEKELKNEDEAQKVDVSRSNKRSKSRGADRSRVFCAHEVEPLF